MSLSFRNSARLRGMAAAAAAGFVAIFVLLAATPTVVVAPLPVSIRASDRHIRYIGRFDLRDPAGPRCAWTGSAAVVRFHGTALNVRLADTSDDFYEVVLDGAPTGVLACQPGDNLYNVVMDLPDAVHTVMLFKRTEPMVGSTQFLEFQINSGARLLGAPRAPRHRLETIGDSITAAYGNEGTPDEHFDPETENGYQSYGAIAARLLKADLECIARSGIKLWPDNSMVDLYDLALPDDPSSRFDDGSWRPDVIVLNLGTNDFFPRNPDRAGWTAACEQFVAKLRRQSPKAAIYLALGPMITGEPKATLRQYLQAVLVERHAQGDKQVRFIEFPTLDPLRGCGADGHPNIKTQEEMGETLAAAISADLHWR
ncbi:MAG: SGNH/GDSL hydrolase family protein [Capsulimonadaceae bacterium]